MKKIDEEALEGEEAEKILEFQEKLEADLKEQMRHLAAASDYKKIMETLQSMESAWDGEDETLNNLIRRKL